MSERSHLTPREKQNGKRAILTPLPSTLAQTKIHPTTLERFSAIFKKAIPPSPPRPKEADQAVEMAIALEGCTSRSNALECVAAFFVTGCQAAYEKLLKETA